MKNKRSVKPPVSHIKKNAPIILTVGLLAAGIVGGGYYLTKKQEVATVIPDTTIQTTTTDAQVQQNVEQKSEAAGAVTTTPSVVTETPQTTKLTDSSFTILRDSDMTQAYISFYGPVGNYGIEKQIGGAWTTLVADFKYSGSGGRFVDTITSTDAESHYRVYKSEGGTKSATSGDTVITWQEILSSKDGTLSVPLAE